MTRVRSQGEMELNFNVMFKDFEKLGYNCGVKSDSTFIGPTSHYTPQASSTPQAHSTPQAQSTPTTIKSRSSSNIEHIGVAGPSGLG